MASQPQQSSTSTAGTQEDDVILTLPNRITVRRYRLSDIPSLSHHGNNKRIWDNLRNRMPHPYEESDAEFWINRCNDPANWTPSGPWTAETGSQGPKLPTDYTITVDGEAVGSIGLDFGDAWDIYFRTAEIGYWLGEAHWGKGVMGVVVPASVEWSWRTFGVLVRLNAEVNTGNVGSRRTLEKAGFQVEGERKWAFVKNGVLGDVVFMGMVRPGAMDREEGRES